MPLRLAGAEQAAVDALDADLRAAARAIGSSIGPQLSRLRPALTPAGADGREPEAVLGALDLDHEGAPDAVSLAACVDAHRTYVAACGRPEAVSAGALALARLLTWAARASLLAGRPPTVVWIGPPKKAPDAGAGQVTLGARATVSMGDARREARAVAVVAAPA